MVNVYAVVKVISLNHPAKVYPTRVGSVGAEMTVPGWLVIGLTSVPSLVTKVMVTSSIDEPELAVVIEESADDVDDAVDGDDEVVVELEDVEEDVGTLDPEGVLENVRIPRTLMTITRTNPIRNHNQNGFLLFLSLSSSSFSLL